LMIAAVVALIVAGLTAVLVSRVLLDESDNVAEEPAPTATAEPEIEAPTATAPITPLAVPSSVAPAFDPAAAADAAQQVLVRVEAYSCKGAEVATGVLLESGTVVTTDQVLLSPWRIDVTVAGQTFEAEPETSDASIGLSTLAIIDDVSDLATLPVGAFVAGDQVGFVGIDGSAEVLTTLSPSNEEEPAIAEIIGTGSGNPVEPADAVVSSDGKLLGIASVGDGVIRVVAPDQLKSIDSLSSPDWGCATDLRDLAPGDTEAVVSPAIAELLTMQQLSDAYADERWADVRRLEPAKTTLTDQQFVNGWRPLRQGFVYPVERSVDTSGDAQWRIALIGHETWNGTDLTTLFCLTWTVDAISARVTQSSDDAVAIYGPRVGQEQRTGFADPAALRGLINSTCPN